MFDGIIRHQQAIFLLKVLSILLRPLDCKLHESCVFRMNPLENKLYGRFRRWVGLEDSKSLRWPEDLTRRWPPAEAPRMTEALILRQVRLALAKRLLGALTFGPICGYTQRTQ